MNCIILADKYEKGSKSKGWSGSKMINKKHTLIKNQVSTIQKVFPKCRIYYVYGFDSKKVEEHLISQQYENFKAFYNEEYNTSGEIYAIAKTHECIDSDCLIIKGNIILKPSMFTNFHKKNHIYISTEHSKELGCTTNEKQEVNYLFYDLDYSLLDMYYIDSVSIELFKKIIFRKEYKNYFLFEIINKMIDSGVTFKAKETKNVKLFNYKMKEANV